MNVKEIIEKLRATESRSKRELLDEAAKALEAACEVMWEKTEPCDSCKHKREECPDYCFDCDSCHEDCVCKERDGSCWEVK